MAKNSYGTGCFLRSFTTSARSQLYPSMDSSQLWHMTSKAGRRRRMLRKGVLRWRGRVSNSWSITSGSWIVQRRSLSSRRRWRMKGECTFVTAFGGLFAPYWIDDARGTICTYGRDQTPLSFYSRSGRTLRGNLVPDRVEHWPAFAGS